MWYTTTMTQWQHWQTNRLTKDFTHGRLCIDRRGAQGKNKHGEIRRELRKGIGTGDTTRGQ